MQKLDASSQYECAIIGAGRGGLVSALYLRRFKRKVILIGAGKPRALWIPRIRNLIGYTEGLSGKELVERLQEQVKQLNTEFLEGEATVMRSKKNFEIKVGSALLKAKKVILATGMKDIQPEVGDVADLCRKRVLGYCPICDGYDYSELPIGILVQDAQGLKKVKFISKFSPLLKVFLLKDFKIPTLRQKEIEKLNVKVYQGKLESLTYTANPKGLWVKFKRKVPVYVRLAYVALGTEVPDSAFWHLRGLRRTKEGFIRVTSHQETSIPGLYAVGDCVNALSQVSVATGHAAIAATRVHNELGF